MPAVTVQGDYASFRSTVQSLGDEAASVLLDLAGDAKSQPAVQSYADQARTGLVAMFEPWFAIPDPARFDSLAQQVLPILTRLNAGQTTSAGGTSRVNGDPLLEAVVSNAGQFVNWRGTAIQAFKNYFINNFDDRLSAQFYVAYDMKNACELMSGIWKEARANVAGIAEQALAATRELRGGTGSAKAVLDLVETAAFLALVIVAAVPTDGADIPAAGAVIAGSKGPEAPEILASGLDFVDSLSGGSPEDVGSGVTDLYGVSDFCATALATLSSQIRTAENGVARVLRQTADTMSAHPNSFRLPRAGGLLDDRNPQTLVPDVQRHDPYEMKVEPKAMKAYAHDMDAAAGVLQRASGLLMDFYSASSYDVWTRDGSIGLAPTGPMGDLDASVTGLADLVADTGVNITDAAAQLCLVALLFSETDTQVMDAFREHAREMRLRDHPATNPLPPSHIQLPAYPGGEV